MEIRKIGQEDAEIIARVHKLAYRDDHFTSKFTIGMLNKFYLELIKNNHYCYLALDENQRAKGFLIAGDRIQYAVNKFMKHNLIQILGILIINPLFWIEKIESFIERIKAYNKINTSLARIRLLSIAVDPNNQRKGLGHELIRHFENDLIRNNIEYYGLSVRKDNLKAITFFEKNNLILEKREKTGVFYIKKVI